MRGLNNMSNLKEKILNGNLMLGVIGLGCVGLSLMEVFGRAGYTLKGYDKDTKRVDCLNRGENPFFNYPLNDFFEALKEKRVKLASEENVLEGCDVLIISVPTPLDEYYIPNLSCLKKAFETVNRYKKEDQLIILQSTVYPGATEELLELLENENFKAGKNFYLGHVPEVVDVGNKEFNFFQIPRIISGITPTCLEIIAALYKKVGCQVVPCTTTQVAESAKLLQNSFRLINISFVNELKIMFDRMGIDIWEVIKVAASKPFGFVPFYPGPGIGGDCIPVDPFYLTWKGEKTNGPCTLLEQAGKINKEMSLFVTGKVIVALNQRRKCLAGSKVLALGVGYKKDVNIIHYSPAPKIIDVLLKMDADVDFHDPFIERIKAGEKVLDSIAFNYDLLPNYDAVLILVDHSFYDWKIIVNKSQIIIDTRNVTHNILNNEGKIIKA